MEQNLLLSSIRVFILVLKFVEENTLYGGIVVVVMFKFMPMQCGGNADHNADYGNIDVFDEQLAKLPVMSEQLNINSFVSSYRSGYRPLYHLEKTLVGCQDILPSSRPYHP